MQFIFTYFTCLKYMRIKSALPHFFILFKNRYEKILNNIKKLINYIDENNLIFCSFNVF